MSKPVSGLILILIALPVLNLSYWLFLGFTQPNLGHEMLLSQYLSVFPTFLQDGRLITWLNILLLLGAVFLMIQQIRKTQQNPLHFKVASAFSWLLIAWNTWSLL